MLKKKQKVFLFLLVPLLIAFAVFWQWGADEREAKKAQAEEKAKVEKIKQARTQLAEQLGPYFLHNQYPQLLEMKWGGEKKIAQFEYTFDSDLQEESENLLKAYKPDYGAVVVMDAEKGQILALANYMKGKESPENLALKGTYPAASIFKIVTATAALDKYNLSPDTLVMFNGGNHTLYKKNVLYTKENKWTRKISLREAFARSINTVWGRLTFEKMKPEDIEEYAIRFGFNKHIQSDLPFDMGFTEVPKEKNFELAEIVSGYNRITRMSPIQGAMIAASVAGKGVMPVPYIIDSVKDEKGQVLFQSEPLTAAITMSGQGAERLKDLMEATITHGTSRKSFKPLVRDKKFKELILGGKTGSLHGDSPRGKVDWFVGYAIGGEGEGSKLAIAAITVNVDYWTVKSSHLAQSIFKKHFKEQFSEQNQKFFNASNNGN